MNGALFHLRVKSGLKRIATVVCNWQRVTSLAALLILLTVLPVAAKTIGNNLSFKAVGQEMWQGGEDPSKTIPLFEIPMNTGLQQTRQTTSLLGDDYGFAAQVEVDGKVGLYFPVDLTSGKVDVTYGGLVNFEYPDPYSFQKGVPFRIKTSMVENAKHVKTQSPRMINDPFVGGWIKLDTNFRAIIADDNVDLLNIEFDSRDFSEAASPYYTINGVQGNIGYSAFKLDSGDSSINIPASVTLLPQISVPGILSSLQSQNVPYVIDSEKFRGTIDAAEWTIDKDFTLIDSQLKANSEDLFIDLALDLDAIFPLPKIKDKYGNKTKFTYHEYISQQKSGSLLGLVDYSASYDVFNVELGFQVTKKQEFTFKPTVVTNLSFTSAVNYCVTDSTVTVAPAAGDICWKNGQTTASFDVGRNIFVTYPVELSPDSITISPQFSVSNTFQNRTLLFFAEPLTFEVFKASLDIAAFDIVPEVCVPPVRTYACWPDGLFDWECGWTTITNEICAPAVSFNGVDADLGPLWAYTLTSALQQQEHCVYDKTWPLGGFPTLNGAAFGLYPKLNQAITLTTTPPIMADYNSTFTVAASGGRSGLPVAIAASGGCSGSGNNLATIAMLSGTTACTLTYTQAGNTTYNAAPNVVKTITARKLNQTITVAQHAPGEAFYNSTFAVAAAANTGFPLSITGSGGCSGSGTGAATLTMTSGTTVCTVTYAQAGNANYNPIQLTESTTAKKLSQTITITKHAPASASYNTQFQVAGTASSGLPLAIDTPDGETANGCDGSGSGTATLLVSSGSYLCTVRYVQAGDGNYHPAPSLENSLVPKQGGTTIAASAPSYAFIDPEQNNNGWNFFNQLDISGEITGSVAGAITGDITVSVNGEEYGGNVYYSSQTASYQLYAPLSTDWLGYGPHHLDIRYSGNSNFAGSSASVDVFIYPLRIYVVAGGATSGYCASWANACDLSYALTFAPSVSSGRQVEIWVKSGTYHPAGNGDRNATFQLKNGVALYGGFAKDTNYTLLTQRNPVAHPTTLSGDLNGDDTADFGNYEDNSYHVVTGSGTNASAILDGFTIKGGNADKVELNELGMPLPLGVDSQGGGMLNVNGSPTVVNVVFATNQAKNGGGFYNDGGSPSLARVTFSGNKAVHNGGGIAQVNAAAGTFTDVVVNGNSAEMGGGMYVKINGGALSGLTFTANTASVSGGGLFIDRSSIAVTGVNFEANSASSGGGMAVDRSGSALGSDEVALRNVTFANNTVSSGCGGGLSAVQSAVAVTDTAVTGNTAQMSSSGGGMCSNGGSSLLQNVTFRANQAGSGGAAIRNDATSTTLTNVTFANNRAITGEHCPGSVMSNNNASTATLTHVTIDGNAIPAFTNYGSTLDIKNSILWGGYIPLADLTLFWEGTSPPTIAHSIVQGGCPSGVFCDLETSGSAPMLGVLGMHGGKTETIPLLTGSAAIDAGDPLSCPATDQRGLARPRDGMGTALNCDSGAFQSGGEKTVVYEKPLVGQGNLLGYERPEPFDPMIHESTVSFDVLYGESGPTMQLVTAFPGPGMIPIWEIRSPDAGGEVIDIVYNQNPYAIPHVTDNLYVRAFYGGWPPEMSYSVSYTAAAHGVVNEGMPMPQLVPPATPPNMATGFALPDPGYHFVRWSDGVTDNPRTDLITGDLAVVALFALNNYSLKYAAGEHGTLAGIAQQNVAHGGNGTAVRAVPGIGYHFVRWCDIPETEYQPVTCSEDNPRTDTSVANNVNVQAEFAVNSYDVAYAAGSNGTLGGETSQTVAHGSAATTVTADPDGGYHFARWSDGSTVNPRTDLNVTGPIAVTAEFSNISSLTYLAGPHGSLTGSASQSVNDGGSGSAVTAVADETYRFVQWSDGSTENPRSDANVSGDVRVTAQFALKTYTLAYTAGDGGSLSGTVTQTIAHGGFGGKVAADPADNYHFVAWSDGSTDNPRMELNVTADLAVTAQFAIDTYTFAYTAGAHGSLSGATPQTVDHGADGTTVEAVADPGYHFTGWSDGSSANPRSDTDAFAHVAAIANFAINTYTLSYASDGHGTLTGDTAQSVEHGSDGTPVEATATPETGYHFVDWSDGVTANPRTDSNAGADLSVTANFSNRWPVSYVAGENGTLTGAATQSVLHGATSTAVTAEANEHYHFVAWSDDSTANPRSDANVTAALTFTAKFAPDTFTVTYAAGANGTILGNNPQQVNYGESSVEVTAEPVTGYTFVAWSDGSTVNPRSDANVTADVTVSASFDLAGYTLDYSAEPGGTVEGETSQSVLFGGSGSEVVAVADSGYHFVAWSDGVTTYVRSDSNVAEDLTITARFARNLLFVANDGLDDAGCTNWSDPCPLQRALSVAGAGTTLWVRSGVYRPTSDTDRSASFQLRSGVALYGGFNGSESELGQRDIAANATILSGELGLPEESSDNAYHVVTALGCDAGALLDGFIVEGGQADGSDTDSRGGGLLLLGASPTLAHLTIRANHASESGGGIFAANDSSPALSHVTLEGNQAALGGGLYSAGGAPVLVDSAVVGNQATYTGGGLMFFRSAPTLTNVTVALNTAATGGGIFNDTSTTLLSHVTLTGNSASDSASAIINTYDPTSEAPNSHDSIAVLTNSLAWGNTDEYGNSIINDLGTLQLRSSLIEGGCPAGAACADLLDSAPLLGTPESFAGAPLVYPLLAGSPAINGGDDAFCAATDQRGLARPQGKHCDIGAYEYDGLVTISYATDADAHGTISGGPQTISLPYGNDGPTVTAVADSGYVFIRWSDGSTANPRSDSDIVANLTVTALFADITPPNAPIVIGVSPTNDTTPVWRWTSGGGGNGQFRRRLDNGTWVYTTKLIFIPAAPLADANHALEVQERDAAGNWSASGRWSISVQAALVAPLAASDLTGVHDGQVTLGWNDNSDNETAFRVYRRLFSETTWSKIAETTATAYTDSTVSDDSTWYYYVAAYNGAGSRSSNVLKLVTGTLAAPNQLKRTVTAEGVNLTWYDVSSNEDGFTVYRRMSGESSWSNLTPTPLAADTTSYVDTTATDALYSYQVCAVITDAGCSCSSSVVVNQPSTLTATYADGKVDLAWSDNSGSETGFKVYRKVATAGSFTLVAQLAADVTGYSDTTVVPDVTYSYYVTAHGGGITASSTQVKVTTGALLAPDRITATAVGAQVDLSWRDRSSTEDGYEIWRTDNGRIWSTLAAQSAGSQSYTDPTSVAGKLYRYLVCAVTAAGGEVCGQVGVNGPGAVSAVYTAGNGVTLDWTDNSTDEFFYQPQRRANPDTGWVNLSILASDSTTASDLPPGSGSYSYRICAWKEKLLVCSAAATTTVP